MKRAQFVADVLLIVSCGAGLNALLIPALRALANTPSDGAWGGFLGGLGILVVINVGLIALLIAEVARHTRK